MTTQEQVRVWLSQVVYKPGWEMDVAPNWFYGPQLVQVNISALVEDSCHPGQQVRISSFSLVPDFIQTFESFCDFLADALLQREKHEAQEWLRHADTKKPIVNPHAGRTFVT